MRRRERNIDFQQDQTVELVASDVLKQVGFSRNFNIWMGFLTVALVVCLYAYTIQLRKGLSVTGLGDLVSWGMYIATFVFFVATSLVGMLISSVLGLIGYTWIKPSSALPRLLQ